MENHVIESSHNDAYSYKPNTAMTNNLQTCSYLDSFISFQFQVPNLFRWKLFGNFLFASLKRHLESPVLPCSVLSTERCSLRILKPMQTLDTAPPERAESADRKCLFCSVLRDCRSSLLPKIMFLMHFSSFTKKFYCTGKVSQTIRCSLKEDFSSNPPSCVN